MKIKSTDSREKYSCSDIKISVNECLLQQVFQRAVWHISLTGKVKLLDNGE